MRWFAQEFIFQNLNASPSGMLGRDPQIDGKLLKLQTPSLIPKGWGGQVNSLGYGKRTEDVTMDNPQPRP